ncbi:hypothetical protein M0804_003614 [Polistes exclamans]|nr:hypothetical protein M0804_003614 [Polistes exclamans]
MNDLKYNRGDASLTTVIITNADSNYDDNYDDNDNDNDNDNDDDNDNDNDNDNDDNENAQDLSHPIGWIGLYRKILSIETKKSN